MDYSNHVNYAYSISFQIFSIMVLSEGILLSPVRAKRGGGGGGAGHS